MVSRVQPGGEAEQKKVLPGSLIVGVNDVVTTNFEEIMEIVNLSKRPICFILLNDVGTVDVLNRSNFPVVSSIPEPIVVETEATFHEVDLGRKIEAIRGMPTVTFIVPGKDIFLVLLFELYPFEFKFRFISSHF